MGQVVRAALALTLVLWAGCVRTGYSGGGDGAVDARMEGARDLMRDGLQADRPLSPDMPLDGSPTDQAPDRAPDQGPQDPDLGVPDEGPPPDQAPPLDKALAPPDKALPPPDKALPPDGPVLNPSGAYTVSPTVSYKCAVSLVNFTVSTATLVDDGKTLTVITGPTGPGGGCNVLSGDTATDGAFTASCVYPGSCTETYTLTGTFTAPTSWTGSYTATYTGSCLNCTSQSWTVTGTHQ